MIDFRSEENIDFIVQYNPAIRQLIRNTPYIQLCKVLEGQYAIIYVPKVNIPDFFRLIDGNLLSFIPPIQGLLGTVDLEASGILAVQNQPYLNLKGQGILLGFVDTGIDYTKEAFRYADGSTRIVSIWDQTIDGAPPTDYCYGAEYTGDDINAALHSEDPYSIVPHRDDVGHGTFLASVAGGREGEDVIGAAPFAELLIVKLAAAKQFYRDYYLIPSFQENAYSASDVMMGLDYLVNKAAELRKPIAICLGVGSNFNGHDGYALYERFISDLALTRDVFVAIAAGNESSARHHTMDAIAENESADIEIYSGEKNNGFMMLILTQNLNRMSVSVTSPLGETVNRIPLEPSFTKETRLRLENTIITVEYYYPLPTTGSQITFVKFKDPTPGIWIVTVYGDYILNGEFHAWLPVTGLVDPDTVFLSPDPYYTVTGPSTAFNATACGAYSAANQSLYVSSSWGPGSVPPQCPDLVAPGVNVTGVYPWGSGAMSGTSVAAAITAGAGALMLQWGVQNNISLNSVNIRAYLTQGCTRRPELDYPNYQWGYGELNLIHTFELMR